MVVQYKYNLATTTPKKRGEKTAIWLGTVYMYYKTLLSGYYGPPQFSDEREKKTFPEGGKKSAA